MTAVAAPSVADQIRALDLCTTRALRDVRLARAAMDHSPSGANVVRVQRAEQTLDDLLDQRLAIHPTEGRATS